MDALNITLKEISKIKSTSMKNANSLFSTFGVSRAVMLYKLLVTIDEGTVALFTKTFSGS
jgi:hypothetical protein